MNFYPQITQMTQINILTTKHTKNAEGIRFGSQAVSEAPPLVKSYSEYACCKYATYLKDVFIRRFRRDFFKGSPAKRDPAELNSRYSCLSGLNKYLKRHRGDAGLTRYLLSRSKEIR